MDIIYDAATDTLQERTRRYEHERESIGASIIDELDRLGRDDDA